MSVVLRLCFSLAVLAPALVLAVGALLPTVVFAQATLENPAPNSFQSGIGVISGWACEASRIDIEFDNDVAQRWRAGTGTERTDTRGVCEDTDNGFGLLFNWNHLGDGLHTVRAFADGVEFASVTVTVTTLGEEFRRDTSGEVQVSDFPTPGTTHTLRWQEAQQNFVITDGSDGSRGGGTSGAPPQVLENPAPGSFQSGIGVISGWACEASRIDIEFDNDSTTRWRAGTGTERTDTRGVCGDTDNGFGLLFNWNHLDDGLHTVRAFADGVEFASVTVTVATLGEEFARGLSHEVVVPDFPHIGTDLILVWQEAAQNFVIAARLPTQQLVAANPVVTFPEGVSIPNVAVRSLYTETAEVLARPEPSLLLAEDAEGTVLLGVANTDGGVLGERSNVEVSVDSTAVVLVALRAGYAVHEIDQEVVAAIQGHADYADLALTLAALVEADKNFLDTLIDYPDVVETIETISGIFGANGPHSRRVLSLKYSQEGVASTSEVGPTLPSQGVTGKTDDDDCSHRAALWSMAEGADIAAMFAPVESVVAALRRAATAEQSPPPPEQSDPQDTEELSLREIMKFFTDLTAAQHAGRGAGTRPAPETQPAGEGECNEPTGGRSESDSAAPGGEWWELAMRGYMDHRGTVGAERENPFLACLPPDNSEAGRRAREVVAQCVECHDDPLVGTNFWLTCFEARQHPDPAWATAMGFDNYAASGGRCVNIKNKDVVLYDPDDPQGSRAWMDRQCRAEGYQYGWLESFNDARRSCETYYGRPCPPPVPDSWSDDPGTRFAQAHCAKLHGGAEAAEEAELCKVIHTYREEGCKGRRECIKREVVWEPCRRATPIGIIRKKFRDLSKALFKYICEKECTPDGEVRCKVRKTHNFGFGNRGGGGVRG